MKLMSSVRPANGSLFNKQVHHKLNLTFYLTIQTQCEVMVFKLYRFVMQDVFSNCCIGNNNNLRLQ